MDITASHRRFGIAGQTAWALAGFGLYIAGAFGAIFIVVLVEQLVLVPLGVRVEAGHAGLSIRNALHPLAWGGLVAALAMPVGRRLVPEVRFSPAGWLVLVSGLTLGALTLLLVFEWVRARFGYLDTEYVGSSLYVWPAMVAIALAGWATLAAPPGRRIVLSAATMVAIAGLGASLFPSVAGAADGIEAGSIPLAGAFVADVVYAAIVGILVVGRRGASPH